MRTLISAVAVLALVSSADAQGRAEEKQTRLLVGPWIVTVERDRFNDTALNVTAAIEHDGSVFGVRCRDKVMSFALAETKVSFRPGDRYRVQFRADRRAAVERDATALTMRMMQIDTIPVMLRDLLEAGEIALRVKTAVGSYDRVFRVARAREALKPVLAECPLS